MIAWLARQAVDEGHHPQKRSASRRSRILFSEHHLSHAASAFFCSPFDEAAILTVDGVGEWTTATIGRRTRDRARRSLEEIRFPHSLGLLYSAFTAFLGFEVNEGEYKVMGMAPYGEPRYVDEVRKLIRVGGRRRLRARHGLLQFHHSTERTYSDRFVELFGAPRDPRRRSSRPPAGTRRTSATAPPDYAAQAERNQYYADLAASIQAVTEEMVLRMARHAHRRTGPDAALHGRRRRAQQRRQRSHPARRRRSRRCTSSPRRATAGGALGRGALRATTRCSASPRGFVMEHAYWGQQLRPRARSRRPLDAAGVAYEVVRRRGPAARPRGGAARQRAGRRAGSRAASSGARARSATAASSPTRAAPT